MGGVCHGCFIHFNGHKATLKMEKQVKANAAQSRREWIVAFNAMNRRRSKAGREAKLAARRKRDEAYRTRWDKS